MKQTAKEIRSIKLTLYWNRWLLDLLCWSSHNINANINSTPETNIILYINYISIMLLLAAKSLQSCPTLCDPIDGSPPGSPIPGILQARTLEWVAISFSNAWKWKVKVKSLSRVRLLATPWTAAYQAPPSMGFSRQSTGVGCHCLLWYFNYKNSLNMARHRINVLTFV